MKIIKQKINRLLSYFGYSILRKNHFSLPPESSGDDETILNMVRPYTMTSPERIWSLLQAVKYVEQNKLDGAFVECGVWRGGSAMVMALKCMEMGERDRMIWLYDTFEGMTEPSEYDRESGSGARASDMLSSTEKGDGNNIWCIASYGDVIANLKQTDYPFDNFHLIKGDVNKTLDQKIPEKISLLRLDTDWYESTKHELEVLYPKLVSGGVCIIDDYGHWAGAKKAVDEYLSANNIFPLFIRVDDTGRIFIKP